MRSNITRDSKADVTPAQFHSKQQEKLCGMVEPDEKIAKVYIDEISADAKPTKNSLYTNFREVNKIVNNLNPSAAYDAYDISTKQLKLLFKSKNFINMIIEMWNNIVTNGRIAQTFKWDKIIYLWKKKGVKHDPKYYRPITLVTAISKIIEGLLHLKIKQELPCPADIIQHAYKPSRSIQTALLDLDEKLSNSNKKSAAVMFLDLKGAFESVDHISLTYYINKFSPRLSNIVKSYLTNRIATIYSANFPDDKPRLEYMKNRSVPQGSKVSPLLFSIATGLALKWIKNRLLHYQSNLNSDLNIVAYADDVAITINADSPEIITNTITTVSRLFKRIMNIFGGDLEPSKTEVLISETTAYSMDKVVVQGESIKPSTMIKWLGYHIKLNQNSTIKVVIPQSKKMALYNSINLFHLYNKGTRDCRNFFLTYIRPIIEIWMCIPTLEQELTILENKLIRKVMNVPITACGETLRRNFCLKPIRERMLSTAENLYEKGIITNTTSSDNSGVVLRSGSKLTTAKANLKTRLSSLLKNDLIPSDYGIFEVKKFKKYRNMVKRKIKQKICERSNKNYKPRPHKTKSNIIKKARKRRSAKKLVN